MTSTITNYSNQINTGFPIAGQDNSSQGFTSNFSNIQNAFNTAATEISNLQTNSINVGNAVNSLNFNTIINGAEFQNSGDVAVIGASSSTNSANVIPVNFALGSYQSISISSGTTTLSVENWPPVGINGKIRLAISSLGTGTITFNTSLSSPPGNSPRANNIPYTTTSTSLITVWDLWSPDSGTTVFVNFIGTF